MTQGPCAGVGQGSHFTKGSQEEALGYFQLTYRSVPRIFSAIRGEEKTTKINTQQPKLCSQLPRSNSVTQDSKGLKPRQIWPPKPIFSSITERPTISRGRPMAHNCFSMKNHYVLIPRSSLQYLLCPWRLSSISSPSD